MVVKARAGGQGRVRGGRPGAQQGSGSTPSPPAPDPSLASSAGSNISSVVGAWTVPGSLSAETTQFFDRLVILPSSSRQSAYAALIDGLVSGGVWAKLDMLYVYAAENEGTALVSLKASTPVGVIYSAGGGPPTFTADRGFSNCGAPSLRGPGTGYFPATFGGNFTQNDAMACAWQLGTATDYHGLISVSDGTASISVLVKYTGPDNTYWNINGDGSYNILPAPADASGFWLVQRTGATASALRHNDTAFATSAAASAAINSSELVSNPSDVASPLNTVSLLAAGGSLTSGQQTALYNGCSTYLTAVGAI